MSLPLVKEAFLSRKWGRLEELLNEVDSDVYDAASFFIDQVSISKSAVVRACKLVVETGRPMTPDIILKATKISSACFDIILYSGSSWTVETVVEVARMASIHKRRDVLGSLIDTYGDMIRLNMQAFTPILYERTWEDWVLRAFLSIGFDPNVPWPMAPEHPYILHSTIFWGGVASTLLLLEEPGRIHDVNTVCPRTERTPLSMAVYYRLPEIVERLVELGANPMDPAYEPVVSADSDSDSDSDSASDSSSVQEGDVFWSDTDSGTENRFARATESIVEDPNKENHKRMITILDRARERVANSKCGCNNINRRILSALLSKRTPLRDVSTEHLKKRARRV